MSSLLLQGDDVTYGSVGMIGDSSLRVLLIDDGTLGFGVGFLGLIGTTSLSIGSTGTTGGFTDIGQVGTSDSDLTTVTIKGSLPISLGSASGNANTGDGVATNLGPPETIHSSLTLINASATTDGVKIFAGATNTSSDGAYFDSVNYSGLTVTYTGLTIEGGSGTDFIENDAKNGIVTDGNGNGDLVILGGAGATATLGTGSGDQVAVGLSFLGTSEAAGSALGDKVTFGAPATAILDVDLGAEAGSTASTASIGLTKVHDAAGGMVIDFTAITTNSNIVDETAAVATAANLTTAENAAVDALGGPGVAYFVYKGSEYFIATNNIETAVSSGDAIVKLVGVVGLSATDASGLVTLHA
jgi:hypothetical protein